MNSLDEVVSKLKRLAPLSLAGSWDNVGLLVEPCPPKYVSKVMLTIDLTSSVLEEAKDKTVDLIIAYHPPIFAPLKRLTQSSWKQKAVLECIENRIAVFSPHTTYDAIQGGINDWLLSAFDVKKDTVRPVEALEEFPGGFSHVLEFDLDPTNFKEIRDHLLSWLPSDSRISKNKEAIHVFPVKIGSMSSSDHWRLSVECNQSELNLMVSGLTQYGHYEHIRVKQLDKLPLATTGMGRQAELASPVTLNQAITQVKNHLGLQHVSVATAQGESEIQSVAVCAGSGSSVLKSVRCDLLVTGEMSHHEVLDAVHRGCNVILCHHSNTERGYLKVLQEKLAAVFNSAIYVFISETDRDPLVVV
ncbi:NIF3-like protein 1 [Biomphalaria pfeifferi]|uniref:NIF3-like protein 1 n=1 Tax=Biomphalaria pfeifferi TaxID=112525 RepID=A0AAD8B5B2_BIOPF|nr:NIF3-like protein 1 [Biomphalaria pfeifferi]